MSLRNALEFLALAGIWGASFLFMRIAVPELGPFSLMLLRCAIGAATLLPVLLWRGDGRALIEHVRPIAATGAINSAIPFVLLGVASLVLTAGVTSILNSLAPLWTAVIAFFWFKDRLDRWQLVGLALGIVGVVVLVGADMERALGDQSLTTAALAIAFLAGILATMAYGAGANLARGTLRGISPLAIATGSQLAATAVLLVPGVYFWPDNANLSRVTVLAVLTLGVVCTGLAYLLFFRLIGAIGATRTVSVTFVIPIFGVGWGALFLGERISPGTLAGAAVIVLGTALTIRALQPARRAV